MVAILIPEVFECVRRAREDLSGRFRQRVINAIDRIREAVAFECSIACTKHDCGYNYYNIEILMS